MRDYRCEGGRGVEKCGVENVGERKWNEGDSKERSSNRSRDDKAGGKVRALAGVHRWLFSTDASRNCDHSDNTNG